MIRLRWFAPSLVLGVVLAAVTDCKPRECADADSPEECAEVEVAGEKRCLWAEYFAVATAPMCSATPVRSGCVEVDVNDGGCGRCYVNQAGDEVAVLAEAVNCNDFPDDFVSCQPDVPSAACDCGCK